MRSTPFPSGAPETGAPSTVALASPLRIALMLESDYMGGAEVMLLQLARALRARGHQVHYVGPNEARGWLGEQFREAGFPTHGYVLRRAIDPACVRGLEALFRRERIDVVHSHEFAMAVYGAAAARRVGIPQIVTLHGNLSLARVWRRRVASQWAFRRSAAVVSVSESFRVALERALGPIPNLAVIPNGVPEPRGDRARVRAELGLRGDELLVLALGTLIEIKGHHLLLEALRGVGRDAPWRLAIGGRLDANTERVRGLVAEFGWEDRVRLLGPRGDVPDLLAAADLFVQPSLTEAMPLALLEAMYAGLPVVASAVGGMPEAVSDGETGLLAPPGDVPALREALGRLLADPSLRARLGAAARERAAARFSIDVMTDAYVDAYVRARAQLETGTEPIR